MNAGPSAAAPLPSDVIDLPMPYICCAADRTYRAGSVPHGMNEDAPGAATADPRTFDIDVICDLFGPVRYRWRFPSDGFVQSTPSTEDLRSFYMHIATQHCPASVLVRMRDVVLANSVIYAGASTTPAIVYETCRPNDRPALQLLSRAEVLEAAAGRPVDTRWQNIFIGSAGSANYGHWLVDDLPRLKAVTALQSTSARPVRVLLHSYGSAIDQVRIDSIRLLFGTTIPIEMLDPCSPHRFRELYYATPVSRHPIHKSPAAIDYAVRETVFHALEDGRNRNHPTLLFVGRDPHRGRELSNYTEVRQLVTSYGFTTVNPESMTFADQVRLFTGAQIVIGQMGAAMTNTMFCRPSTSLIYLAPTGWGEPFYWDLSVVRGQNYRVLFGDVIDESVPPHCSNFSIDCEVLKRAINAL